MEWEELNKDRLPHGRGSRAAMAEIVPDNFLHVSHPWLPDGIFCVS